MLCRSKIKEGRVGERASCGCRPALRENVPVRVVKIRNRTVQTQGNRTFNEIIVPERFRRKFSSNRSHVSLPSKHASLTTTQPPSVNRNVDTPAVGSVRQCLWFDSCQALSSLTSVEGAVLPHGQSWMEPQNNLLNSADTKGSSKATNMNHRSRAQCRRYLWFDSCQALSSLRSVEGA